MKKLILFLMVAGFLMLPKSSYAQYGCETQYGGCPPSLSIMIDKTVAKTVQNKGGQSVCDSSLDFKDNFVVSDVNNRFHGDEPVCFQLKVKNTSGTSLQNVTVKDFVPSYLNPIEGPGSFDSNSRTISFSAGDFDQNQEKVYFVKMQVFSQSNLPSNQGLFCTTNKAQAYNDKVSDDDTAQLCIEKTVTNVTQAPKAGPEFGLVVIAAEFGVLGLGAFIKRKNSLVTNNQLTK